MLSVTDVVNFQVGSPNAPHFWRVAPSLAHSQVISTNWPDPDVSAAGRVTALRLQTLRQWMGEVRLTVNSGGWSVANHGVSW